MGCIASKAKYVPTVEVPGQDANILPLLASLGIEDPQDINMFFTAFHDMDVHHSGFVRPVEMYTYFGVDIGTLETALFNIFDDTKSGKLDFVEFVCSMWNFLSSHQEDLAIFVYLMKDPSAVMRVKYTDILNMLEIVHKRRVDNSPALTLIYNDAKSKLPAETSLSDFVKWAINNLSMVSPLVVMQIKLRKKLLGERFWAKMVEQRSANSDLSKLDFTKKLQASIKKIHQETKEKKLKADKEKLQEVKASLSASQKNIQHLENALVDNFLKKSGSQIIPQSLSSRRLNTSTDGVDDTELDSPVATTKKSRKNRPASAKSRPQSAIKERPQSAAKERPQSAMKGSSADRPQSAKGRSGMKRNISFKDETEAKDQKKSRENSSSNSFKNNFSRGK